MLAIKIRRIQMDSKIKKHSALRDGFFIAGTVLLLFFSLWKS